MTITKKLMALNLFVFLAAILAGYGVIYAILFGNVAQLIAYFYVKLYRIGK